LLEPKGQFGTRLENGKDSASPRYIFTNLAELTFHIFNPLDNPLLEYNEDDGLKIEPIWYIPILPMVLINGSEGIGTGFSTKIPCHDPEIIVQNLKNMMDGKKLIPIKPWFRGFQGKIDFKSINDYGIQQFTNYGAYKLIDETTVHITELPIGRSTEDYKTFLETLLIDRSSENNPKQCLVDFINYSTEKIVKIILKFKKDKLKDLILNNKFEALFKLFDSKYTNYSNMNLYNNKEIICKYDNCEDILIEFYHIRLIYYVKRKEYMLKTMQNELDIFKSKIRFIEGFIDGSIDIIKKEDDAIYSLLEEKEFPKFASDDKNFNYDYLLNMRIRSLTLAKTNELKHQYELKLALFNEISSKEEKDLWKEDLDKFLVLYKKKMKEYNDLINEQIKKDVNKLKIKKITKSKK